MAVVPRLKSCFILQLRGSADGYSGLRDPSLFGRDLSTHYITPQNNES